MIVWDLCSGLGGWSEAFVQAGHEVFRFENNPDLQHIPHTYCLDVRHYADWISNFPKPDLILASPPCLQFSLAFNAPKAVAARAGESYEPDMSVVQACLEIIQIGLPQWWILENVAGACPDFKPLLGSHRQKIGPFFLWGKFPYLPNLGETKHSKSQISGSQELSSNVRALIPFELSWAVLQLWREQTTLLEWL